ncbi:NAD-binding protein [Pluteus cervinus]|uniref:NAD-binding protein n=1 Tax=Pluteus cervinus TaxID=181527 RepID=A0ACD3AUW6_9AGAR|nr:NAD-binding protein [Pluteus cervinus]
MDSPRPTLMLSRGVALVTGASRGIGRAIALRLAHDGFEVAVNDLSQRRAQLETLAQEISEKGRKTTIVVGDVSANQEVLSMTQSVAKELGSLDVMVANAGIHLGAPVIETPVEDWDHLFSINARGVFLCYKYAALQMIAQGKGGRIIGASSCVGETAEPGQVPYSATKFAVRGLTQGAAQELGQHGITVNCYAPGAIDTHLLQQYVEAAGSNGPAILAEEINNTLLGRIGKPEEVAGLVSYLASPDAAWVTGQTFSINGGRTLVH